MVARYISIHAQEHKFFLRLEIYWVMLKRERFPGRSRYDVFHWWCSVKKGNGWNTVAVYPVEEGSRRRSLDTEGNKSFVDLETECWKSFARCSSAGDGRRLVFSGTPLGLLHGCPGTRFILSFIFFFGFLFFIFSHFSLFFYFPSFLQPTDYRLFQLFVRFYTFYFFLTVHFFYFM